VKNALGDYKAAFDLANSAEALSQNLTERYPNTLRFKHLLYASKFRMGDQLARALNNKDRGENAEHEYLDAVDLAKQLATIEPAKVEHQHELIVALNKVGDIHQYRRDWEGALQRYNEGLRIAQSISGTYPGDEATEKNRIAQILSARNQPGDRQAALSGYRDALNVQTNELVRLPSDASLISNIAAIEGRKKLYHSDPGNIDWSAGLATDYMQLGDLFMQKADWRGAIANYNEAIPIAEAIVSKDPASIRWQRNLAALYVKRADISVFRANEVTKQPELPQDEA
jgi:tetratricopeptide (TPR) repeat protein